MTELERYVRYNLVGDKTKLDDLLEETKTVERDKVISEAINLMLNTHIVTLSAIHTLERMKGKTEMTEEDGKIDNSLRTRASEFHDHDPQAAFNLFVDRMAFATKKPVKEILELKLSEECREILGVDGYTGTYE